MLTAKNQCRDQMQGTIDRQHGPLSRQFGHQENQVAYEDGKETPEIGFCTRITPWVYHFAEQSVVLSYHLRERTRGQHPYLSILISLAPISSVEHEC